MNKVFTMLSAYDSSKVKQWRGYKTERERSAQRLADLDKRGGTSKTPRNLQDAQADKRSADRAFVSRMCEFEQTKIKELKVMWGRFATITVKNLYLLSSYAHASIQYHLQCLQALAIAHQSVVSIDDSMELAESLRGVVDDPRLKPLSTARFDGGEEVVDDYGEEEEEEGEEDYLDASDGSGGDDV